MNAKINRVNELGFHDLESFHSEAFKRNIGFLSRAELASLRHKRIAIPGLGGVGGVHLITLIRTGICNFNLADFDTFDVSNANRQYGAKVSNYKKPKLDSMINEALEVNPYLNINSFPKGVNESNIDEFLDGVDLVVDSLDVFVFDFRRMVFNKAREKNIPVVSAGPLGFGTAAIAFGANEGMNFDEYFDVRENMTDIEKFAKLISGLAPKALHSEYMDLLHVQPHIGKVPSLGAGCQFAATTIASMAVKILTGRKGMKYAPHYFSVDPYLEKLKKGKMWMGNRNPLQKLKIKYLTGLLNGSNREEREYAPELPNCDVNENSIPVEAFEYIIEAGKAAPSGENTQPWKFEVVENKINLLVDLNEDKSFFNFKNRAALLSCGAVMENMRIAATSFGLEGQVFFNEDEFKIGSVGYIELKFQGVLKDNLQKQIWERNTNRRQYSKKEIEKRVLNEAGQLVEADGFAKIHWLSGTANKKKLRNILEILGQVRQENKNVHEFLHSHISYTFDEHLKVRNGFPLRNLQAGAAGEFILKLLKPWSVMKFINAIGVGKAMTKKIEEGIVNSGAIGLITVPDTSSYSFLKGGQILERVWLNLTQNGIAFQPMTTVNFFDLRIKEGGGNDFEPHHLSEVKRGLAEFYQLYPEADLQNQGQIMLFRIGYAKDVQTWTVRKKIESVLASPIKAFAKAKAMIDQVG